MKHSNLISIILPAYNCMNVIDKSIISIRSQTYSNWELIIVDDCSNDNTVQIVRKIAKEDPRIKLFTLKENSGPSYARQFGISHSKGKYITFVDSDDWYFSSDILANMVKKFEENAEIDCVMCRYITSHNGYVLKKGKEINAGFYNSVEARRNKIINDSPMWHYLWNKLYLADVIREKVVFQSTWSSNAEDVKFNRVFLKNARAIYVIDEYGYCYNCQGNSLTRTKKEKILLYENINKDVSFFNYEYEFYMREVHDLGEQLLENIIMERLYLRYLALRDKYRGTELYDTIKQEFTSSEQFMECFSKLGFRRHFINIKYYVLKMIRKLKNIVKNMDK